MKSTWQTLGVGNWCLRGPNSGSQQLEETRAWEPTTGWTVCLWPAKGKGPYMYLCVVHVFFWQALTLICRRGGKGPSHWCLFIVCAYVSGSMGTALGAVLVDCYICHIKCEHLWRGCAHHCCCLDLEAWWCSCPANIGPWQEKSPGPRNILNLSLSNKFY